MKWYDFLFSNIKDSFKIENLINVFIHESQKKVDFQMINRNYWYIIIIIDKKFIHLNEFRLKENDDNNNDNKDNSYNQMIIHSMKMINKIYTWFQDLMRSLISESIDIFHDISNHW